MYMNVTMLISVMGITTPKPILKLAHRRIYAIMGSSLKPRLNLLNMRSSMQAKPGLVLTVVSSQRVMTKELCTSIIGHSMSTGTSINVPLMGAVLMGILLGTTNSTWYGGICRRIMGCTPPWGALSVMAHFVPNKHNKNTLPHVQGRRPNVAPMVKKNTRVMSVLRSTPQRLHSKVTKRCTRAEIKNMCAASVAKL